MMDYDYQSCTETLTSLISLESLGCDKCVRLSPLGLVSRVIVKCGECNECVRNTGSIREN